MPQVVQYSVGAGLVHSGHRTAAPLLLGHGRLLLMAVMFAHDIKI